VNPDVAESVDGLEREAVLAPDAARVFRRVARRELVSLYAELRLLAYAGVLLMTAGVGFLVKDNLERIGPFGLAALLTAAAAACFVWVAWHARPFARGEVPSDHLAFDYVLLLGALLAAADLAYVEAEFTPLGAAWAWHLLIVSIGYGLLAFRYDSRIVFSLALTTFAAWRGVSSATLELAPWRGGAVDAVRANAAICGVLFLILGVALVRLGWKAHFEPAAVHLGWLLLLLAPLGGLGDHDGYAVALLALASALTVYGFACRRFVLFAMGVLGAYVGLSALVVAHTRGEFIIWWFALTSLFLLPLLIVVFGRLKEEA
jgi:hypothetical protein